jgi:hypothetical protein
MRLSVDKISFGCRKDYAPLLDSMEDSQQLFGLADDALKASFELMDCARISTVYADLVYDGTCTHTIQGFAWSFSCLLIVSILAMMMITLRSSYQNTTTFSDDLAKTRDDSQSHEGDANGLGSGTDTGLGSGTDTDNDSNSQSGSTGNDSSDDQENGSSDNEEGGTQESVEEVETYDIEQAGQANILRVSKKDDDTSSAAMDISCFSI